MSFLTNDRIFKRAAWVTLLLTAPVLSGALQAADALLQASQPPQWENSAYEMNAGSWVNSISENYVLEDDHRKIFDWVRTEVEYVPYAGLRQSAEAAAASARGNAIEQSSLLGVLLKDAGYDWRFATGDIKLTLEEAERWLGINGATTIRDVLERSGLEVSLHPSSRNADSIVIEDHVWVQVEADFYPVAASAEDDTSTIGNTPNDPADRWLDLDPSITYRYTTTPSNISSLTGLQPSEVIDVVEESTGSLIPDVSGNFTEVADLPTSGLENLAIEAGDRVDQLVTDTGRSLSELLGTDRLLEMEQREVLPGTLPGEVVGKVSTIDPENISNLVSFLQKNRNRIALRVTDGILSKKWNWIGAPQTSVEPLTLSFMAIDDPENYPDIRTTGMETALSVPHQVSPNGTDPVQPLLYVKPVLMIGSSPIADVSDDVYHFGEQLDLEVTVSGPGGSDSHLDSFSITAGGVYVISANNILRTDNIEELTSDISSIDSRFELLQKTLDISAQSILQREQVLTQTTTAALEQYVSYPSLHGVVVGLEPAIYDGKSNGVRMAVRRFGKNSLLTSSSQETESNKAAARVLVDSLEDLSNAAPLGTIGGHEGYQTPGRIFAIELDEGSQTYRQYEQGVLLSEMSSNHLPGSEHPSLDVLEEELLLGTVHISDAALYTSQGIVSALNPGFATVSPKARNGATSLLGYTAEDSSQLGGWTPLVADQLSTTTIVTNPMEGTMIAPLQLILAADGSGSGVTGELVSIRNRTVELVESTIGISQSMIPAVTAAALLNAPHLSEESTWAANIPSALTMIHKTADSFIRPQITSFDAEVLFADDVKRSPIIRRNGLPILNTLPIEDTVMGHTNEPDGLTFEAVSSRRVDLFTVTFNPQEVDCEVTPNKISANTRKIVDSFEYGTGNPLDYRLDSCLMESGMYELRAFGQLTVANLVSEPEIIEIEVDNTSPTVKLVSPEEGEVVEGIYSIHGTVNDDNFYEWYLSWKEESEPASSYQILNGYRDTNRFPGEAMEIAVIDTQRLGWKGDYNIALTGVDEAGNQHTQEIELTVSNDNNPPEITLTGFETEPGGGAAGEFDNDTALYRENTYTLTLDASDNEDTHDRGLKSMRVWIEESGAGLDAWSRELAKAEFKTPEKDTNDPALATLNQSISDIELDVSTLPVSSLSTRFVIKAEAVDHRGNSSTTEIANLSLGNVLWSFNVRPPSFKPKATYPADFQIQMTREALWKFDIYPINIITGEADYNDLQRSFTSNGQKASYRYQEWYGDYESGTPVPSGPYEVAASITYDLDNGSTRTEAAFKRINVVATDQAVIAQGPRLRKLHNPRDPATDEDDVTMEFDPNDTGTAEVKTDFFIEQGSIEPIEIHGALGDFALGFLDGSFQERMPEFESGYRDAFWALEFKSASAEPFLSDIQRRTNPGYSLTNRDNWKVIAWDTDFPDELCEGTECDGSKSVKLADWDTKSLPLGYYDLRLWVTDGSNMVHHVVGGLKVVPKSTGTTNGPGGGGPGSVGALTLSSTDLAVPFSGFTAEITRDYNSKDTYNDGPFGYGWKLRGINMKVETYDQGSGEVDEAFITLPDGREFWFANVPPKGDNAGSYLPSSGNVWNRHGEYLQRPYGMRLYRPGGSPSFHNPGNDGILYQFVSPGTLSPGDSGRNIEIYYNHPVTGQQYPRGSVAYLQTEDKTWYVFQWKNGELLEIIHPDGQRTDFVYDNDTSTVSTNNDPNSVSSEVLITDLAGRMLTLERDSSTGRISAAVDPNGHRITYEYDDYGNLSTVTDRRGFKRFYIYDTPETLEYYRANFPDELDNITGNNVHHLIDVRIDDDRDIVENFTGDTFSDELESLDLREQTEQLLASQNWPGDKTIMKVDFCGGDDVCAYESRGKRISLDYNYDEDGAIETRLSHENTNKESTVTYNENGKIEKVVDIYGAVTKRDYGTESLGNIIVSGVLLEETDALGNKTSYEYPNFPTPTPGSYSEIFENFLNSKLSGDCPTLYGSCQDEYVSQTTPGYLTNSQVQPSLISYKGKSEYSDDWIETSITYDLADSSTTSLSPVDISSPTRTRKVSYNDDGSISGIKVSEYNSSVLEDTNSNQILEAGDTDGIFGTIHSSISSFLGRTKIYSDHLNDTNIIYGYRLLTDIANQETDLDSPDFFEETVSRHLNSESLEYYLHSRYDAQDRLVESFMTRSSPDFENLTPREYKEEREVFIYDAEGELVQQIDPDGDIINNFFDYEGKLIKSIYKSGLSNIEENGITSIYIYNEDGENIGSKRYSGSEDGVLISNLETESFDLPLGSENGSSRTGRIEITTNEFDVRNESRYDLGNRLMSTRVIESDGKVVSETAYSYNLNGRVESEWHLNSGTVEYEYDDYGRLHKKTDNPTDESNRKIGFYHYDKAGKLVATGTAFGSSTEPDVWKVFEYDEFGNKIKEYPFQSDPFSTPLASDLNTEWVYNSTGRVFAQKDVTDKWMYIKLDDYGSETSIIYNWQPPESWNNSETTKVPIQNLPPRMVDSNLVLESHDENLRFDFEYDKNGNQISILHPGSWPGGESLAPVGYLEIQKEYDDQGRVIRELFPANISQSGSVSNSIPLNNRRVKLYNYDNLGRLTRVENVVSNIDGTEINHNGSYVVYDYLNQSYSVSMRNTYNDNRELERTELLIYDETTSSLSKVITKNSSGIVVREEKYIWDNNTGRINGRITPEGTITYNYDKYARLSETITSTGNQTEYRYDDYGRLSEIIEPGLSPEGLSDSTISYTYNANSRISKKNYPNGTSVNYEYSNSGGNWIDAISHTNASGEFFRQSFSRDSKGTILRIAENHQDNLKTWDYGYDGLNRLKEAKLYTGIYSTDLQETLTGTLATDLQYDYDRRGNRTYSRSGSLEKFNIYNSLDENIEIHDSDPAAGPSNKLYSLDWNNEGRISSVIDTGNSSLSKYFEWSGDHRLKEVKLGEASNSPIIRYTYDSSGTRIARSALDSPDDSDPDQTRYLVDYENHSNIAQVISEQEESGDVANYIFGKEIGALAQFNTDSENNKSTLFFHPDHLHSTKQLTASDGSTVVGEVIDYEPFGAIQNQSQRDSLLASTTQAFTGQYLEDDSGLQYHRSRWLDTAKGGWISHDQVYDEVNWGNTTGYGLQYPLNGTDVVGTEFSLVGLLATAANIAGLVTLAVQSAIWIHDAMGLRLLSESHKQKIENIIFWIDMATLPFSLKSIGKLGISAGKKAYVMAASLGSKVWDLSKLAYNGVKHGVKYRDIIRNFGSIGMTYSRTGLEIPIIAVASIYKGLSGAAAAMRAIQKMPEFYKLPKHLGEVATRIAQITDEAYSLVKSGDIDLIRATYRADFPEVVNNFVNAIKAKEYWKIRTTAGTLIHEIVKLELDKFLTSTAGKHLKHLVVSNGKTVPGINGIPDIVLQGNYVLDITTTKQAFNGANAISNMGKAEYKYGAAAKALGGDAIDIAYESFDNAWISKLIGDFGS